MVLCTPQSPGGSQPAGDEPRVITADFQTGKLVVDLISDNATTELTS